MLTAEQSEGALGRLQAGGYMEHKKDAGKSMVLRRRLCVCGEEYRQKHNTSEDFGSNFQSG